MDYLDPKKEFQHRVLLLVGYICIAVAVAMAAIVLLYQAYGFGIGKDGTVIQNGLVFFSSQPSPANIYIDGKLNKARTNSRVVLREGVYNITLARDGYADWKRTINLEGGSVEHFDYPFLFPSSLKTVAYASYKASPAIVSQSLDRRWLAVQQPDNKLTFDVYDLKNYQKPAAQIALPASAVTLSTDNDAWTAVEWADDNSHLLLQHTAEGKSEYILLNRTAPDQSVNLTATLSEKDAVVSLKNRKYDNYFLYNPAAGTLDSASLSEPKSTPLFQHVLAYKSYGNDTILYVTDNGAPAGKVLLRYATVGEKTMTLKSFPAGSTYLVDLTKYGNAMYVTAGAASQDKIYIFKDPVSQLSAAPKQALVPAWVLHVKSPSYVSFSPNAQFVVAENGQQFAVYDIENKSGHSYVMKQPIDAPQQHAVWMDGNRLFYVSGGKVLVFDYDAANQRELAANASNYVPAFSTDYKFLYTMSGTPGGQMNISQTSLLAPSDQ